MWYKGALYSRVVKQRVVEQASGLHSRLMTAGPPRDGAANSTKQILRVL